MHIFTSPVVPLSQTCSVSLQVPVPHCFQYMQQKGPGRQSGERRGHVLVQHARGQGALRGPEVRQRLCGGGRRVWLRGAWGELKAKALHLCFNCLLVLPVSTGPCEVWESKHSLSVKQKMPEGESIFYLLGIRFVCSQSLCKTLGDTTRCSSPKQASDASHTQNGPPQWCHVFVEDPSVQMNLWLKD